jgi:hypothetical protein
VKVIETAPLFAGTDDEDLGETPSQFFRLLDAKVAEKPAPAAPTAKAAKVVETAPMFEGPADEDLGESPSQFFRLLDSKLPFGK